MNKWELVETIIIISLLTSVTYYLAIDYVPLSSHLKKYSPEDAHNKLIEKKPNIDVLAYQSSEFEFMLYIISEYNVSDPLFLYVVYDYYYPYRDAYVLKRSDKIVGIVLWLDDKYCKFIISNVPTCANDFDDLKLDDYKVLIIPGKNPTW